MLCEKFLKKGMNEMAIEVFNRFEYKYKMDKETLDKALEVIEEHMTPDKYCKGRAFYTIANIYYDTPDNTLIRRSLSKPIYKEKLRLRSYGVPDLNSKVYLEIKKKFNGLVNKRRTTLLLNEAYDFTQSGKLPEIREYMNVQVMNEIEYFLRLYGVVPKVYIAYDRMAFFENGNDDLRISFDTNIRTRRHDLNLEKGDYGRPLLDKNIYLMEIKTSRAIPLWLTEALTSMEIRRSSFSKYGTEYNRYLASKNKKSRTRIFVPNIASESALVL